MSTSRHIHPSIAYAGPAVVGGVNLAISGFYQWHLAQLGGMSELTALSLPVALDTGGAVASVFWIRGGSQPERGWGKGTACGLLAASTGANVAAHGLMHGWWWCWLGVVYPVIFWLMVKLVLLYQAAPAAQAKARNVPAKTPAVIVEPATAPPPRTSSTPPTTDNVAATALAWAVAELAAGRAAGRKVLLDRFGTQGLTDYQSRQVAAQAKAKQPPHGHPLRLAAGQ